MKERNIAKKLKENSSFIFLSTLIGVLLIIVIKLYFKKEVNESFFYIIHTAHIFIFALISSALFFKHKLKTINALTIGLISALILASLSDIIFPFIGAKLFHLTPTFHFPLIENPFVIISTGLIGSLIGIITKFTKIPFFIQIFLSVFAGIFYLVCFSRIPDYIGFIFLTIIIFVSTWIVCYIRDFILPFSFSKKK